MCVSIASVHRSIFSYARMYQILVSEPSRDSDDYFTRDFANIYYLSKIRRARIEKKRRRVTLPRCSHRWTTLDLSWPPISYLSVRFHEYLECMSSGPIGPRKQFTLFYNNIIDECIYVLNYNAITLWKMGSALPVAAEEISLKNNLRKICHV